MKFPRVTWMLAMLAFVPITVVAQLLHAPGLILFILSSLAIVPLAGYMSEATDDLAKCLGPAIGGLLNATFGNATELIITLIAVHAGELAVVRASIIGSIIGNILLVLGLSVFIGGLKYKEQKFNEDIAGTQAVMLMLAVVTIIVPSLFVLALPDPLSAADNRRVAGFSLWVAGLLIAIYIGNLFFSLVTHREMFLGADHAPEPNEDEPAKWGLRTSFAVLAAATAAVAYASEVLVGSIGPAVQALHVSTLFVGIILVPIIGNAAEHATAVVMALRDKMDTTVSICVSSSTQIALFVAPLIVFLSYPLGHPMPFVFSPFEVIAVGFAAYIAAIIARDGDCNWFEGAQLLALYAILACAFYFVPPPK